MIDISSHITMFEATHSNIAIAHGIDNTPDLLHIKAMQYVAQTGFEPLRAHFNNEPIQIDSFYRCHKLNNLPEIGGAPTGHPSGECIDMKALHRKNAELYYYILKNLPFDQLIWEFGTDKEPQWIHYSLRRGHNRHQALRAKYLYVGKKRKRVYEPFE